MQVVAAQGETARPGMKVLATIMPVLGYGGMGPGNRPVPSKVYFDLATWHLVNTNYAPRRMAELKLMRDFRVGSTTVLMDSMKRPWKDVLGQNGIRPYLRPAYLSAGLVSASISSREQRRSVSRACRSSQHPAVLCRLGPSLRAGVAGCAPRHA